MRISLSLKPSNNDAPVNERSQIERRACNMFLINQMAETCFNFRKKIKWKTHQNVH